MDKEHQALAQEASMDPATTRLTQALPISCEAWLLLPLYLAGWGLTFGLVGFDSAQAVCWGAGVLAAQPCQYLYKYSWGWEGLGSPWVELILQ